METTYPHADGRSPQFRAAVSPRNKTGWRTQLAGPLMSFLNGLHPKSNSLAISHWLAWVLAAITASVAASANGATLLPAETFQNAVPLLAAGSPINLTNHAAPRLVDWDGDTDQDLLVAGGNGYVWLFLNSSSGPIPQFNAGVRVRDGANDLRDGTFYTGACFADMSGDGLPDLIVVGEDNFVRLYPNRGSRALPTFNGYTLLQSQAGALLLPSFTGGRIDVADWDGDGLLDIIAGESLGYLTLFRNTGTQAAPRFGSDGKRFLLNGAELQRAYNTHPRVFDLNQDGVLDIAYGINWGHFGFLINGNGKGTTEFIVENIPQATNGSQFNIRNLITDDTIPDFGDLNNDGVMDIVSGGLNGQLYVAYGVPGVGPSYRPRVMVDLSHEFTFRYDIFGAEIEYWTGANQIVRTSSFRNISSELLDIHDCLVINQLTMDTPFSPEEVELIANWVASGGGLWIAGDKNTFNLVNDAANYPLAALAEHFGITFGNTARQGPYMTAVHPVAVNVNGLVLDASAGINTLHTTSAGWQPIITDTAGSLIIAARSWGSGRVIVSAEDSFISNPYQQPNVSNVRLLQNMIKWLSEGRRGNRGKVVPLRVLPENRVTLGAFDFYFPGTLAGRPGLSFLQVEAANLVEAMENQLHKVGLTQKIHFVFLSTGGGGYSSGEEIGIGSEIPPPNMLQVTAHELTHSFDGIGGGLPSWMHGWASFAAIRTARLPQYGGSYQATGDGEYDSRVSQYLSYEAANGSNSLDITEMDRGVIQNSWAIGGKLMKLIEGLEQQYGADLMPRIYRIKRLYRDDSLCDTSEMVRLFGLAAGTNVRSYFVSKGTTVPINHLVAPIVYSTDPPCADPFTARRLTVPAPHLAGQPITIEFNSAIQSGTVNSGSVSMTSNTRGNLSFSVTQIDAKRYRLHPTSALQSGESVTVRLTSGITSITGNALDGNGNGIAEGGLDAFSWSFQAVTTAPSLSIERDSAGLFLSWPTTPTGFSMQSRNTFASSDPWAPMNDSPILTFGRWKLKISIDRPSRFFRLAK